MREVVYLEEFEAEVYNAHRYVYHTCKRCRESTIWNEAAHEPTGRESVATAPGPPSEPAGTPAPRTRNDRRYNRVSCNLRACIRYPNHDEEEALEVKDVSRGGVCFTTHRYLAPGTKFAIAIPYSPGMANIFVPAEIVRANAIPDTNLYECGATYLKPS
jgi:hypothetical protein